MARTTLRTAALTLLATGVFLGVGCGSNNDCTVLPEVAQAPTSCSLVAGQQVTVSVRWCSCGSSTTCDVGPETSGFIQLEPKVRACDASCETNPASCSRDTVPCIVKVPTTPGSYHLIVNGASSDKDVPVDVVSSGTSSCT